MTYLETGEDVEANPAEGGEEGQEEETGTAIAGGNGGNFGGGISALSGQQGGSTEAEANGNAALLIAHGGQLVLQEMGRINEQRSLSKSTSISHDYVHFGHRIQQVCSTNIPARAEGC